MNLKNLFVLALAVPMLQACPDDEENRECTLDVDAPISEPTAWQCSTINVLSTLDINAPLTIDPGTEVLMAQNTSILVKEGGSLNAKGTKDEPIVFRGAEQAKSYWGGIAFQSVSPDNALQYVTVSDTGAAGFQNNKWALALLGGGVPKGASRLADITINNAGGYGLSLSPGAEILGTPGTLTFDNIDDAIIRATADSVHQVQVVIKVGENVAKPWKRVERGIIEKEVLWGENQLPYRLVETPRIEPDGLLRVGSGVTIEFGQDVMIDSGSGKMTFTGFSDSPIVLTGIEKTPGYWGGLAFHSVSEDNLVQHTVIEYAGGKNYQNATTALIVGGTSTARGKVAIVDSVIRESGDQGIIIRRGGEAILENVVYEGNNGPDVVNENSE